MRKQNRAKIVVYQIRNVWQLVKLLRYVTFTHKKSQGIVLLCFFKFLRTGRKIAYSYHCGVTERATDRGAGQNKRVALSLYTQW